MHDSCTAGVGARSSVQPAPAPLVHYICTAGAGAAAPLVQKPAPVQNAPAPKPWRSVVDVTHSIVVVLRERLEPVRR